MDIALYFGMHTAKPFEVKQTDFNLSELDEFVGGSWLTSLAIKVDDVEFVFNEVIISLAQEKNIVTTAMPGYDGTIKEFIGEGDYQITINAGVIAGGGTDSISDNDFVMPENRYPESELKKLQKILKKQTAVSVHSDFLEIFEIRSAVIQSFNLRQETHSNIQTIQIQMLSDKPFEIEQLEDNYVEAM